MATITLQFKKKELNKFPIKKNRKTTIGRRNNNHITIDNISVSGHHAEIETEGDDFLLKDLKSKNGTFVNQRLITSSYKLNQGDVITIGKHELAFSLKDEIFNKHFDSPESGVQPADETRFLDTFKHHERLKNFASTSHRATLVTLQFKGKMIRKYLLKANTDLKIGRLNENDVIIDNSAVSGKHALITMEGSEFVIKDLDSTNGVLINDNPISTAILNDGDVIKIGKHDLVFSIMGDFEPSEIARDSNIGRSTSLPSDNTTFIEKKKPSEKKNN